VCLWLTKIITSCVLGCRMDAAFQTQGVRRAERETKRCMAWTGYTPDMQKQASQTVSHAHISLSHPLWPFFFPPINPIAPSRLKSRKKRHLTSPVVGVPVPDDDGVLCTDGLDDEVVDASVGRTHVGWLDTNDLLDSVVDYFGFSC
jgi:hypothetical protein